VSHQNDSPANPLADLYLFKESAPELVIISGPSGSGKTHACIEFADFMRAGEIDHAGLISIPIFKGGLKTAIDLLAIHTGEQRRLAALRGNRYPSANGPSDDDVTYGKWRFDPETFAWGNAILSHLPESDCFLLDELGPLEFRQDRGLTIGMSLLDKRKNEPAFVVVREELLRAAHDRWPWSTLLSFPHDNNQMPSGRNSK